MYESDQPPFEITGEIDKADTVYVAEQINPWVQPQVPPAQYDYNVSGRAQGGAKPDRYYDWSQSSPAASPGGNKNGYSRRGQFVTQDELEKLKRQQMQYQTMPENWRNSYGGSGSYNPGYAPGSGYQIPGPDPIYDSPMVSPWSSNPDVLYRGQQFPMLPNEALGGLPPVHVSPFGMSLDNLGHSDSGVSEDNDKVFNPFTFLPNYGSQ